MKLFLVEDEIIVREGIKKNIDWQGHGIEFAGEASDGELAFPIIQDLKPDIVITDIKMPFMDGLELSKLVKKEMPSVKIIILSGYDEFQYAKEAIKIGVTEYLLKPVSSQQVLDAVLNVKSIIETELQQRKYINQYQKDMQEMEQLVKKHFFNFLVRKKLSVSEILDKASELNLNLSAQYYNMILIMLSYEKEVADAYTETLIKKQQELENALSSNNCILFQRDLEGLAVLIKGSSENHITEHINSCLGSLSALVEDTPIQYFVAVGAPVKRLTEMHHSFDEANRVFAYRYFLSGRRILYSQETPVLPFSHSVDINLETVDASKMDMKVIEQFLRSGMAEDISAFVHDFLESLGSALKSVMFRQYVSLNASFAAIAFVEELGFEKKELSGTWDNFQQLSNSTVSMDDMTRYLTQLITKALSLRSLSASSKYHALIKTAQNFIQAHYPEDLTLNQIAATVNISPNYFSSVFSQETGQTFIEYLTAVRMKKARELLKCSDLKTSEICYAVGYKDSHYFSYLFKKINGVSPKEYRKSGEGQVNSL